MYDRFGGVPTSVAMPPMSAAYAMASITATPNRLMSLSGAPRDRASLRTARPIGIRTITVAVFEIHIDSAAEAIMNPSTIRDGRPPTQCTMPSAIRRCSPLA